MLALLACSNQSQKEAAPQATSPADSARLTAYLDAEFEKELQMSPEWLTQLGRKDQYDKLDDRSEGEQDRQLAWRRKSVADMKATFNYALLDDDAKTSYDIWALELERSEKQHAFRRHPYLFARNGVHVALPQFLMNFHRVDSRQDMDAYIARIALVGGAVDQMLVRAQAAAADGIRQPAFAYAQAIDEVKRLTSGAPFTPGADSSLYADAKAKIAALRKDDRISAGDAAALTNGASKALIGMRPAYDRLRAWLESDRVHASTEPQGASALPNGSEYYNSVLALQTTTTMTADQIHDLGLSEVARIRGEMEAIKDKVGFKGTLPAFFAFMRSDRQFFFPNTDQGRADYLALAEKYLGDMQKKLSDYFGILPKAGLIVKRVEPFREEPGGAAHYFGGTPDGSRPGIFYSHLSDMSALSKTQLEDIAYHEGVPGHHLQISIQQERAGLPKFRTQYTYNAYTEGWGLYAEALAKEMGFFTDPYSDAGRLGSEIWRAIRLVVDTGIHAKGWTQQQAVDYFLANSPLPEGAVRSEVRRYINMPGQATTYKIGMIAMQRLRDEARQALGPKFDYHKFHDVMLAGGSMPLPVLEANVRRWIAASR